MRLKGKSAVVTGAGRNIGEAIVLELAREGADVVVSSSRDQAGIERVALQARGLGVKALPILADVRHADEVEAMVKRAVGEFGKVDILVNNAVRRIEKPFVEMSRAEWDEVLDVVLNGAFNCIKAVIAGMMDRKQGRIINLAGVAGQMGLPGRANICASKSGIIGLTKGLAREFAPFGVTVNAVSPGPIDVSGPGVPVEELQKNARLLTPLGRLGQPREIATMCVYLASDEAAFITGQTISVNGGMYM